MKTCSILCGVVAIAGLSLTLLGQDKAPVPATQPACHATTQPAGDMAPLELKLPKPAFIETPKNIRVDNLQKPAKRGAFLVPAGCVNVALGKPVTSSDSEPIIGELKYVTDGSKEATEGSYVELGPMLQWVQIDLQAEYKVYAVVVWHYHGSARVYFDVVVQAGDDKDFIENVQTVFNNDHDNSSGLGVGKDMNYIEGYEGKLIDAGGIKARFLRFYSRGSTADDQNHYTEVEVYALPAK